MNRRAWLLAAFSGVLLGCALSAGAAVAQVVTPPAHAATTHEEPAPLYPPPGQAYVNADIYYHHPPSHPGVPAQPVYPPEYGPPLDGYGPTPGAWEWQLLPDGLIYHSYLAGPKEPRISSHLYHEQHDGTFLDATLGGRVALWRFGTLDTAHPEGWEVQLEGAAFPRIDLDDEWDMVSSDFRAGVPLVYGLGSFQFKFGYYHLSSHLGDELMVKQPGRERINYSRDSLVLGVSYFPQPALRLYAETSWAFYTDGGAEPWEFQFGFSYSPQHPTGLRGAPFLAANGLLREEVDYGGIFNAQAGWQWRGYDSNLLRAGVHYQTGHSNQYQFFSQSEEQIGFGVWYDY